MQWVFAKLWFVC